MQDFDPLAQQLLHFSPDALLIVDPTNRIRYANGTAANLFGYPSGQLPGLPIEALIPERFRPAHTAHVAGYFGNGMSNREMGGRLLDLFARRLDGTEFPVGIRLAPIEADGVRHVAVAVRDMTERRRISDALIAAREEADRANRAKSRFLAAASHDLRQPMQVVRLLNASLLRMATVEPSIRDLLLRQEHAIDTATDLLNALLDISRLESGAIEPVLTAVELAGVFTELQREFEAQAMARRLDLQFAGTGSRLVLMTDRTLLMQLLQNLIGNALKYTERGFVRVAQSLAADDVLISIEDSGVGIPADKLERIFDEYYQIDAHGAESRLGVGLGLAIVREVSRLLNVEVSVTSRVGVGTTVTVRIPRERLLVGSAAALPEPPAKAAAAPSRRCGIVLVEDNASVRAATELFLNLEGFRTRSASGAAEAQSLIAAMLPGDILVTDFRLAGKVTGLDIVQHARAGHSRRVPAVLLSGDLEAMLRTLKEPLADARFLRKPVDVEALLTAIGELGGA